MQGECAVPLLRQQTKEQQNPKSAGHVVDSNEFCRGRRERITNRKQATWEVVGGQGDE